MTDNGILNLKEAYNYHANYNCSINICRVNRPLLLRDFIIKRNKNCLMNVYNVRDKCIKNTVFILSQFLNNLKR